MKLMLRGSNLRDYCLFILGINSGLRVSDLLRLNIEENRTSQITKLRPTVFYIFEITYHYRMFSLNRIREIVFRGRENNRPIFVKLHNHGIDNNTFCSACRWKIAQGKPDDPDNMGGRVPSLYVGFSEEGRGNILQVIKLWNESLSEYDYNLRIEVEE